MTFAKISIEEIKLLHNKKASALEILVYQVISSHIHSNKRQNAFPSLNRIANMLGGTTSVQSISRAVSSMVKKGLMKKGKIRSQNRFLLIHRPINKITKKVSQHAKTLVSRYAPSSLSKMLFNKNQTKSVKQDSQITLKQRRQYKRGNQVENSKNLYKERGEEIWRVIAPTGFDQKIKYEKITEDERQTFKEWVLASDTEQKRWILESHKDQMEMKQ